MPAVAADDSLIGFVLADKYRIIRVIGKGGMGIVYEAEHITLGKRVAIKLMLDKYFEDGEAKSRFKREAQAASMIGNQHIIDVSDIGALPDGRMFVVMELLNGVPLSDLMQSQGPMPPWRAIAIMKQVLKAVGAAHSKGIIHRDLKPDNIFLVGDQHDFVKLLDFGISKVLDPDEQVAMTKLTSTGVVMGTPLYMAPEQAMGQVATKETDIYACGVILYEMLAGRTPFIGPTYAVLVAQLLTAPPEPLANLRPGLPLALVNAVHKALEKEQPRRFSTAEMFAASLPGDRSVSQIELAGTLDSGIAVAVQPPVKKSRGTLFAVGGALVLGAATAAILIATQRGGGKDTPTQTPPPPQLEAKPDVKPEPKPEATPDVKPTQPAATGTLKLTSRSAAKPVTDVVSQVFVDGTSIGNTPAEITLKAGPHVVRFEAKGYDVYETPFDVDPGNNKLAAPLVKSTGKPLPASAGISASSMKTIGKSGPSGTATPPSDQRPIGPVKPPSSPVIEDKPVEPKRPPDDKPPPNGGKSNPYTPKNNPYNTPTK